MSKKKTLRKKYTGNEIRGDRQQDNRVKIPSFLKLTESNYKFGIIFWEQLSESELGKELVRLPMAAHWS
jgi:hypothetical protein